MFNVTAWMAALNMALAATAEGLGSVMSTLVGKHKEEGSSMGATPLQYAEFQIM